MVAKQTMSESGFWQKIMIRLDPMGYLGGWSYAKFGITVSAYLRNRFIF